MQNFHPQQLLIYHAKQTIIRFTAIVILYPITDANATQNGMRNAYVAFVAGAPFSFAKVKYDMHKNVNICMYIQFRY